MANSIDSPVEKPLIDAPIRSSAEDDLGHAPVAHAFARSILELDASQGLVVAVMGPWGHGKSSFINLMREEFEGIPKELESPEESDPSPEESETRRALTVIDFNPWLFSGSDQLVDFFFTQIGAELKVKNESRLGKIADRLAQYAGIFKPAAQLILPGGSAAAELAAAGISGFAGTTSADRSVQKVRDDITEALSKLEKPIVVIIDDIDRLTKIEIREIFKLVRLTASFPNIIYLLAFDRERVEQALSEDDIPGHEYLEKIVLLNFDLPQAQRKLLQSRISAELDILTSVTNATLHRERLDHSIYPKVIMPLLSNIRDLKRYAISTKLTIKSLGAQVDLVDLLAMEALRVLRPRIFQRLLKLRYELTEAHNFMGRKDEQSKETIIHKLLDAFPDDKAVIKSLLDYVFPAALSAHEPGRLGSWQAAHRMADIEFLNLYFDRVAPDRLVAFRHSEHAFSFLNNRAALKKYLIESVSPEMLKDVIFGFISLEEMFTDDMTVPGSITLLNLIGVVPEQQRLFDAVGRVVYKLLCHVENKEKREEFIEQILKDIETYSSKIYFIDTVLTASIDGGLLPTCTAFKGKILRKFCIEVGETPPSIPSREWDIGRVYNAFLGELYNWEETETPEEKAYKTPLSEDNDPVLLQKVLHSFNPTELSQSSDSSPAHFDSHLDLSDLVKLFGSKDEIVAVLDKVRKEFGDDEILQRIDKYLDD